MNSNKLKLNTDKTEVMPVGSASRVASVESAQTLTETVFLSKRQLNTSESISIGHCLCGSTSTDCRASLLELRRAASIRPYLSQSATARFVAAMVSSRLDYCNSVFAGLPADQVARLQRIQNNAARLVMKKKKMRSRYTSPQRTSLVTCEILLPV